MDAAERLLEKAHEYEVLAASYEERCSFDPENKRVAVGFTVIAIVLREVADALGRGGVMEGQLALFRSEPTVRKERRYVPKYEGDYSATKAVLDAILAERRGLKPYEGRCVGCGKVTSIKAPHCG